MMRLPFPVVSGPDWSGARYFTTTRQGGISAGAWHSFNVGFNTAEDPGVTAANREQLCAFLPAEPVWLDQVHGNQVLDADTWQGAVGERPCADAAVTSQAGRVVAVLTADCLPVVLFEPQARVVAVAHAGWRGLAAGVLENTLALMRSKAVAPERCRAWIGPGIHQNAFQVGADVYQAFAGADPEARNYFTTMAVEGSEKWLADLPGLAALRLSRAGLGQVSLSGRCTYAEPNAFYSYRLNSVTGRMATVAWLD